MRYFKRHLHISLKCSLCFLRLKMAAPGKLKGVINDILDIMSSELEIAWQLPGDHEGRARLNHLRYRLTGPFFTSTVVKNTLYINRIRTLRMRVGRKKTKQNKLSKHNEWPPLTPLTDSQLVSHVSHVQEYHLTFSFIQFWLIKFSLFF